MKKLIWIITLVIVALGVWWLSRSCKRPDPSNKTDVDLSVIDTMPFDSLIELVDNPEADIPRPPFEIFFLDQLDRPVDKGAPGSSYTAKVYVLDNVNKKLEGPYRGSTFPNSISNSNNLTNSNTAMINVPEYLVYVFNNRSGHKGSTVKGLNLIDVNQDRKTPGYDPNIIFVTMECVNVHTGASDNGNYNSRGSRGCLTIHPQDVNAFFENFNFENGTTGTASGVISVVRSIPFVLDQMTNEIKQIYEEVN